MAIPPLLASIQIGLPRNHGREGADDPLDKPWNSGIFKSPIDRLAEVGVEGLEGDGQADRKNHGGPDKAICVYSAAHFPYWERTLDVAPFPAGGFGENFTVTTLVEADVCIGDTWQIGTTRFQVSQPRQPCWKLGRRWRRPDLPKQVVEQGGTGWYFRVLVPGDVAAGERLELVERPCPEWTIARANDLYYRGRHDREGNARLADVVWLAQAWRQTFKERAGA